MPSTDIKDYWRRSWGIGDRQPFAEAGLADPANNIVKGQDLGTGILQRLKDGKKIKYITSAVKKTNPQEHKSYKDAKDFRETLIEKYKIGDPKAYKGKYNYKELIKDKAFEKFWKAKVDAINTKGADSILQGIGTREALQKVIKKYNLKPNDYEGIFNKLLEEVRITEGVRKNTASSKGKTKLVSNKILDNLMETFKKAYKPTLGTIDTKTMGKLLKLPDRELERLMGFIDKSIPAETAHLMDSDVVSRTDKAAAVKKMLNDAGITFEKHGRIGEGSRWRFKLDKDIKKADQKFKKLEKSKTFGFVTEKPVRKYPINYKDKFTEISRKSAEYKKMEYSKDSGAIRQLTKALNNAVKGMSDAQLLAFVNANPKIKNLVTVRFDPSSPNLFINTPLEKMTASEIRQNLQFEKDHIQGRSTVKYDAATKKILDGIGVEYPKNLYLIPKALNISTKQRVENFVANYPNETEKIKKIDKYFKDNKISYYNRRTGTYGGARPSKSAVELGHLGIKKTSELKKLLTGTYKDTRGNIKPITKNVTKLIAIINEQNKARGGISLIDDMAMIQNEASSKGVRFNSFAGFMDFANSGIEIPPAVRQAADRVMEVGGKFLRGFGKAAIVLDPIFAAMDASEALGKGASGKETGEYVVKRFAEGVLNIPGLVAGAAKYVKDKATGTGEKAGPFEYLPTKSKFDSEVLPWGEFTFAQDKLKKQLDETPENVKLRRITEIEFDQTMPYMVDVMDMPDSREELEIKKDKFLKEKLGENYKITHPKQVEEEKQPTDNLTGVDKYMLSKLDV
jgi:hypothetical protein